MMIAMASHPSVLTGMPSSSNNNTRTSRPKRQYGVPPPGAPIALFPRRASNASNTSSNQSHMTATATMTPTTNVSMSMKPRTASNPPARLPLDGIKHFQSAQRHSSDPRFTNQYSASSSRRNPQPEDLIDLTSASSSNEQIVFAAPLKPSPPRLTAHLPSNPFSTHPYHISEYPPQNHGPSTYVYPQHNPTNPHPLQAYNVHSAPLHSSFRPAQLVIPRPPPTPAPIAPSAPANRTTFLAPEFSPLPPSPPLQPEIREEEEDLVDFVSPVESSIPDCYFLPEDSCVEHDHPQPQSQHQDHDQPMSDVASNSATMHPEEEEEEEEVLMHDLFSSHRPPPTSQGLKLDTNTNTNTQRPATGLSDSSITPTTASQPNSSIHPCHSHSQETSSTSFTSHAAPTPFPAPEPKSSGRPKSKVRSTRPKLPRRHTMPPFSPLLPFRTSFLIARRPSSQPSTSSCAISSIPCAPCARDTAHHSDDASEPDTKVSEVSAWERVSADVHSATLEIVQGSMDGRKKRFGEAAKLFGVWKGLGSERRRKVREEWALREGEEDVVAVVVFGTESDGEGMRKERTVGDGEDSWGWGE